MSSNTDFHTKMKDLKLLKGIIDGTVDKTSIKLRRASTVIFDNFKSLESIEALCKKLESSDKPVNIKLLAGIAKNELDKLLENFFNADKEENKPLSDEETKREDENNQRVLVYLHTLDKKELQEFINKTPDFFKIILKKARSNFQFVNYVFNNAVFFNSLHQNPEFLDQLVALVLSFEKYKLNPAILEKTRELFTKIPDPTNALYHYADKSKDNFEKILSSPFYPQLLIKGNKLKTLLDKHCFSNTMEFIGGKFFLQVFDKVQDHNTVKFMVNYSNDALTVNNLVLHANNKTKLKEISHEYYKEELINVKKYNSSDAEAVLKNYDSNSKIRSVLKKLIKTGAHNAYYILNSEPLLDFFKHYDPYMKYTLIFGYQLELLNDKSIEQNKELFHFFQKQLEELAKSSEIVVRDLREKSVTHPNLQKLMPSKKLDEIEHYQNTHHYEEEFRYDTFEKESKKAQDRENTKIELQTKLTKHLVTMFREVVQTLNTPSTVPLQDFEQKQKLLQEFYNMLNEKDEKGKLIFNKKIKSDFFRYIGKKVFKINNTNMKIGDIAKQYGNNNLLTEIVKYIPNSLIHPITFDSELMRIIKNRRAVDDIFKYNPPDDEERLNILLTHPDQDIDHRNIEGKTALEIAIFNHDFALADILLSNNATLKHVSKEGHLSLLLEALNINDSESFIYLLENFIKFNDDSKLFNSDNNGNSLLKLVMDKAIEENDKNAYEFLSTLLFHCKMFKPALLPKLLSTEDSKNTPALIDAARHPKILKTILEYCQDVKIDYDVKDSLGKTALMNAIQFSPENPQLLVKKSKINQIDNNGDNALMYAIKYGHENLALSLIEQSIINHKNSAGETALSLAKEKGQVNVVEKILRYASAAQPVSILNQFEHSRKTEKEFLPPLSKPQTQSQTKGEGQSHSQTKAQSQKDKPPTKFPPLK